MNKIFTELDEPNMTKGEFKKCIAKIDFDGDELITLKEMLDFVSKTIYRQEIMMVGIYWIGWSVDPNEKKN